MMGAEAGTQEDMFAKLESMRAVITEVNMQFKDPVRTRKCGFMDWLTGQRTGKDDIRVCVHLRVPVAV